MTKPSAQTGPSEEISRLFICKNYLQLISILTLAPKVIFIVALSNLDAQLHLSLWGYCSRAHSSAQISVPTAK